MPFRPDFVSQFALDRVAMLIERVETAEQLAGIAFPERRYSCLANYLNGSGHERLLIDQLALDHPLLAARIPILQSIARAFDWDESQADHGSRSTQMRYPICGRCTTRFSARRSCARNRLEA